MGNGGYFRNRTGSWVARSHSQKLEPLADTIWRTCWHSAQSPTRDRSRALMDDRGSRGGTLTNPAIRRRRAAESGGARGAF